MTALGRKFLYAIAMTAVAAAVLLAVFGLSDASSEAASEYQDDILGAPTPLNQGPMPGEPRNEPSPQSSGQFMNGPRDRRTVIMPDRGAEGIDRVLDFERMKTERERLESEGQHAVIFDDGRRDPVSDAIRDILGEGSLTTVRNDGDTVIHSDHINDTRQDDEFVLDVADALEEIDPAMAGMLRSIVDYRLTLSSELTLRQMNYVWKDDSDSNPQDDGVEIVEDEEDVMPVSDDTDAVTGSYVEVVDSEVPCLMHVYRYSGGAVDGPAL